jgi:hypothetical protein
MFDISIVLALPRLRRLTLSNNIILSYDEIRNKCINISKHVNGVPITLSV